MAIWGLDRKTGLGRTSFAMGFVTGRWFAHKNELGRTSFDMVVGRRSLDAGSLIVKAQSSEPVNVTSRHDRYASANRLGTWPEDAP